MMNGIKGNDYKNFPKEIQTGILLHRHIDTYTDSHPIVRLSTKRLHEKYGHYSGVIVDILYDHFLAKNWENYSDIDPLTFFVISILNNYLGLIEFHCYQSTKHDLYMNPKSPGLQMIK